MELMLVAFVVMLILVAGMAIGVIMGREPIKGSCGGMAALGMDTECSICGGNPAKCDEENERQRNASNEGEAEFYDASK